MRTTPEACARKSAEMKRRWADPAWRERNIAAVRAAIAKPEARAALRAACASRRWKAAHDALSPEQISAMIAMVASGQAVADVAAEWLVSSSTVYRWCRLHGVPTPTQRTNA